MQLIQYVLACVSVCANKQFRASDCTCAARPHTYTPKCFDTCAHDGTIVCHQDVHMYHTNELNPGLLLGAEAPIMMPNGSDFAFLFL